MPVWAIITVLSILLALMLVILIVVFKVKGDTRGITDRLDLSKQKRIREEVAIEKKKKEAIKEQYISLKKEQEKIEKWYGEQRDKIDKGAANDFEKLISDQRCLDYKLDDLLGLNPNKDTSPEDEKSGGGDTSNKQDKD